MTNILLLRPLTVCCHSHCDALLEATFLALVPGHFVNNTFALVLTGIRWIEILLDCPPEESLENRKRRDQNRETAKADGS